MLLDGIATTAALVLATVWVVAAAAKLRSPSATAAELRALGVPLVRWLAWLVPAAELATGAALVGAPRLGAVLSLLLLVPFTVTVARAVQAGRAVTCGCLGSWSRSPVSWATVGRNAVLVALAGTAAAPGGSLARPDLVSVVIVAEAVLLAAVGVELLRLRSTVGPVWSVRLAGQPVARRPVGTSRRGAS